MKEWKASLAAAIIDEFNSDRCVNLPGVGATDRAVKFSDVAKSRGYNHIDRQDIIDVVHQAQKVAPQMRPIRMVEDSEKRRPSESLWDTLYFTDLEFD